MVDLRLGRWEDVLADVECDAVITDPPFSRRTAIGYRGGKKGVNQLGHLSHGVPYGSISESDVASFADFWRSRCRWWFVIFTDHVLMPVWETELRRVGLYTFAPLAWCKHDAPPRYMADGPSSAIEWIVVARPRHRLPPARMGARRGWYATNINPDVKNNGHGVVGSKPVHLMQAIIREYTLPGDLVCDPYSGHATTALAASGIGRRVVGSEVNPDTYARSLRRIAGGVQHELAL